MKRLASFVMFLFVANVLFAAVGPRCALWMPDGETRSAAAHAGDAHDHKDHHRQAPSQAPDQGEQCSSMQMAAVLSGVAVPLVPQTETMAAWTATNFDPFVETRPVARSGIPPPPLIAADFGRVHARTGRLLI